MVEATKLPIKTDPNAKVAKAPLAAWTPFDNLRREIDRVFQTFSFGAPFGRAMLDLDVPWQREGGMNVMPAVDVSETDAGYKITAELPGMSEKDIDIKLSDGTLTVRGEKKEEREESDKGYYLSERQYGSFVRTFQVPESVDPTKIEATFAKGVLTVTLPKSAEARNNDKTITIKAA